MARRDDKGQALWLVIIMVAIIAALGPIMATSVSSDTPLLVASTNKHAAMAAAQAGIQWYRDNLDSYSQYYTYSATNNPLNDAALAPITYNGATGFCGSGYTQTCGLSGTNPPEAFHYTPDDSQLFASNGSPADGSVFLTVTGRAGSRGHYQYAYVRTSFTTSSVLDDAYFSNYEVLDPNSDTIQTTDVETNTSGKVQVNVPETSYDITYTYTNAGGASVTADNVSAWQALCEYDTYSENTFIDSLPSSEQSGISGEPYSSTKPYYGPYQQSNSFTFDVNGSGVVTAGGETVVTVPSLPCGPPYDFVSGESFSGPVYTNDQLHVCGSPTFSGSPVSLTSGAPSNVAYLWDVPGSVQVTASNSGTNGPYPTSLIGDYVPAGYTVDTVNCDSTDDPTLSHGVALNGTQTLPALNTNLPQYGTASPPSGSGYGCTYLGPTMIELVTSSTGTTTMDVWSPLSTNTSITTSSCSNNSTFSSSNPLITGIPLPTDGVVYVQDYTLTSGAALPTVPSDGSSPCFNPYRASDGADSDQCYEGDVYIEGSLNGQLTVGSAANIIITRDLTDYCTDSSSAPVNENPSATAACTGSGELNVLGLSAAQEVLISGNTGTAGSTNCSYNGVGTPSNPNTAEPAGVWPTTCNPQNIIIDAAILALQGSFGVENWDHTPQSGDAYFYGADLSYYRGPFGIVSEHGYDKEFTYDTRLDYAFPPYILPTGIVVWLSSSYIVCPTVACTQPR